MICKKSVRALGRRFLMGLRVPSSLRVTLCLVAIAATVFGCGWPGGTEHSVRFNCYRKGRDFGRLPPLPKYEDAAQERLFSWDGETGFDYEDEESSKKKIDALWERTEKAEQAADLALVRKNLNEYVSLTSSRDTSRYDSPKDVQKRRNAAIDKLDAFTALDEGAPASVVHAYLLARSLYDKGEFSNVSADSWGEVLADKRLKDNAAYLEAALTYARDKVEASKEFAQLAVKYPKSEKREAALFMAALARMKSSASNSELDSKEPSDTCEDCRDEFYLAARAGFEKVMRLYPQGRYYVDAQGWLAHVSLRVGDRVKALVDYYRMLGGKDSSGRTEALFSLSIVRDDANETEMERVEKLLESEPQAALAYAYHNIYNFGMPSVFNLYVDDRGSQNRKANKEATRIAGFATRMMKRYPGADVGGAFVLRVAEANLELGKDEEAASLARKALSMSIKGDARAEALWVKGVAEHRLHQFESAREALTTLVTENPDNRYTEGARRNLAMLAEDMGDVEGALDQYLALDYRYDVTYFIDVLMTADQLSAFINKRPAITQRDELLYALGVRYLRDKRWSDARQTLLKVKTLARGADDNYWSSMNRFYHDSGYEQPRLTPKQMETNPHIRGIRAQWVALDLRTANDLERLERESETAQGDEAKAEALYQYASYQYQGTLLFYNPAWRGGRHYLLYDLDRSGAFRQPNESQLLFEHMQKHDRASRALPIYIDVVRRFPKTRAARDALYTAAICHQRLAEYNNYWRAIYSEGGYAGDRLVKYADVRAAYPGYRFPLGTFGWEPATRTVNGGPGWVAPPKPRPRPSRWVQALKIGNVLSLVIYKTLGDGLEAVSKILGAIWRALVACVLWVCHWLWIIYIFCWMRFLWPRAAESRMMMSEALECYQPRPKLEREDSNPALDVGLFGSATEKYLNQDLRDQLTEMALDLTYKLRQIARQKKGRSLIAQYSATHGLLIVLFFRLLIDL